MDKKLIRAEYEKNKSSMQLTVEGEIIINDSQPDIKEIIYENTKPAVTFYNVSDGRVSFKGVLKEKAVYISKNEEEPVSSVSNTANFEDIMNIDGLEKDNSVRLEAVTDRCEFRRINERKLSVRAVITVNAQVYASQQWESVMPEENDDIQYLTEKCAVRNHALQNKTEFDIHETFSIPSSKAEAEEILTEFYTMRDLETKALNGGYRIKGVIDVNILYLTGNKTIVESIDFDVPFEQTVDNDMVSEDMTASSIVNILSLKTGAFQDSSGESRIIDIDAAFNEITDIFEDESITCVKDAYSVKYPCETEAKESVLPEFVGKNKARFSLKGNAAQNSGADILRVIASDADIAVESVYADNGFVAAEGVVECTVLYVAGDDSRPVYSTKAYMPFHEELDINGAALGDMVTVNVYIEDISFNILNSSEIEVDVKFVIDAEVLRLNQHKIISDIQKKENDSMADMPAAVIYWVQKNDSLWDIAKRYGAVKEDIMSVNGMEKEDDLSGMKKILVMRSVKS